MEQKIKTCKKCNKTSLEVEFWKSCNTSCLTCKAKQNQKYRDNNEYNKRYYAKNREAQKERRKDYYHKHKYYKENQHKWRDNQLKVKYGITLQDYYDMLGHQNHICKICPTPHSEDKKKGLHVDHCHASGRIRGLLCGQCNTALGGFKDSVELMERAIEYIKNSK